MRTLNPFLAGIALLALGCSHSTTLTPVPPPGEKARLTLADELGGKPLEVASDGPWAIRRTVTEESEDADHVVAGGVTGKSVRKLRARGGGGRGGSRARTEDPVVKDAKVVEEGIEAGMDRSSDGAPDESPPAAGGEKLGDPRFNSDAPFEGPGDAGVIGIGGGAGGAFGGRAGKRRARPSRAAKRLRAGATDDNVDYAAFLEFLDTWAERKHMTDLYQPMDVSDRRYVRVVDYEGRPVPGATVLVVDEEGDRIVATGTTYGDGRVPFYPRLTVVGGEEAAPPPRYLVQASVDGHGVRAPWDGEGDEVTLTLDDAPAVGDPVQLDVTLLIDTTGSMSDEIASIKASLLAMTKKLRSLEREFDLRYGAVLYRDIGDEYLTATHEFTPDIQAFDKALESVQANGGGDGPESLNQGLAQAVDGVAWRDGAAKVVFLIADAPPHMDYPGDLWYGESLQAAVAKGIRIHSVAASGLDDLGTMVFRQIAQFARGKFIFIEYGSTEATAASHGVTGKVKSNNLEDILFEQIRDELARWGRDV